MTTIAFLGLGQMGAPMASRLVRAGHQVAVWNRSPERAEPLVARGARLARSPAEAARGAEAAITMLADPAALEGVLFDGEGLAGAMEDGSVLIEMSTVGPEAIQRVAERLSAGVTVLDAPVLGTVPQAEEGQLKIFVGGDPRAFARWRSVLEVLGTPTVVGPLGAGASMKLVVNSALTALMSTLGEALALADALDLEQQAVLDVLADSPVGVAVTRARERIESGSYPPRFKLSLALKDLALITETAAGAGLKMPIAEAVREWYHSATGAGLGGLDYPAVIAHIRGQQPRP